MGASAIVKLAVSLAGALTILLLACISCSGSAPGTDKPEVPKQPPTLAAGTGTPHPATLIAAPESSPRPALTVAPAPTAERQPPPTVLATPAAQVVLWVTIAEVPADLPPYNRSDWKDWTDEDDDCQDTRQEVLLAESVTDVSYQDDMACKVVAGRWLTPYSATTVSDPGELDVDHMVPLANAHASGAWDWPPERKERFANYLDDPQHLIAVTASANRSKGAKGPDRWRPQDRTYWCRYAVDWITIKGTWGLTVTAAEHAALVEMLDTCANPTVLRTSRVSPTGVDPGSVGTPTVPPTPAPASVYSSCDAAQAAGESRIQGGRGAGMGFPQEMVPSAGDGDGDGVVCER